MTNDVIKFREYAIGIAEKSIHVLRENVNDQLAFKKLAESALVLTILLNGKRVGFSMQKPLYPNVSLVDRPVPHSKNLPVPKSTKNLQDFTGHVHSDQHETYALETLESESTNSDFVAYSGSKFLFSIEVPSMSSKMYEKHQEKECNDWENAAQHAMKEAAKKEALYVIEHGEVDAESSHWLHGETTHQTSVSEDLVQRFHSLFTTNVAHHVTAVNVFLHADRIYTSRKRTLPLSPNPPKER
ncbi:hypothetical protein ILUMI_01940 [Ignelater luminosus]|uniref:Uncharacterized protein n=1 Tax=Ignelater luminosus TaxID=2038154 RepID=A0A8K0GL99_IGNLU|nr:hypothetical protein ILUMI_01940 [Ignelater luminosus]